MALKRRRIKALSESVVFPPKTTNDTPFKLSEPMLGITLVALALDIDAIFARLKSPATDIRSLSGVSSYRNSLRTPITSSGFTHKKITSDCAATSILPPNWMPKSLDSSPAFSLVLLLAIMSAGSAAPVSMNLRMSMLPMCPVPMKPR